MDSFTRGPFRFRVLDFGPASGDIIVALHGFPEFADTWRGTAEHLSANGFRVLAFDQRGYSSEARPRDIRAYKLAELVNDVLALIAAANANRVHLVGHDWGGVVAWALAASRPELLWSMTSVSTPHPRAFGAALFNGKQAAESWYMPLFLLPCMPRLLLASRDGEILTRFLVRSGLKEPAAREYAQRFAHDPGLAAAAANWYRALPYDIPYGLKIGPVTVSTQYIVGGNDDFVSPKSITSTQRWVTGHYRLKVLKDASHWIPEEESEQLAELITEHARSSFTSNG